MTEGELVEVFERQRNRLLKVAGNIVGNHASAEEVVQDAFLNVWESRQRQTIPAAEAPAWFTTTVQNAAKDRVKAERRRVDHEANCAARMPTPRTIEDLDLNADTEAALLQLPEELRDAVLAVVVHGRTEAEHAAAAGITQQAANKRVRRGVEFLRQLLNDESASLQIRIREDETDKGAA